MDVNSWEKLRYLLPSFGFFGSSRLNSLSIKCGKKIKKIVVFLEDEHRSFLNLKSIEFNQNKDKKLTSQDFSSCNASSARNNSNPLGLVESRGFHSAYEVSPWVEFELHESKYLDNIDIYNRSDRWGVRSKSLCVKLFDDNGDVECEVKNQNHKIKEVYNFYMDKLSLGNFFLESVGDDFDFERFRQGFVVPKMLDILDSDRGIEREEYRWIFFALPIWSGKYPTNQDIQLLGKLIAWKYKNYSVTMDDIKSCSSMLSNKAALESFEETLKKEVEVSKGLEVMLTKHGISPVGKLLDDPEFNVSILESFFHKVQQLGGKPMLAYGTLLGAVRSGSFIEHDDDIDIFIDFGCRSKSEAESSIDEFCDKLKNFGYKIGHGKVHLNRHVKDAGSGIVIDCFPFWRESGCVFMHMERMVFRGLDERMFSSTKKASLYGVSFDIPIGAEEFLYERYGKSWGLPDKYHEWPWDLNK